jgi:hypothetical protein
MNSQLVASAESNKGSVLYDFDQTGLSDFNDLCGDGPSQRTGLCLGLCMAWVHTIKTSNPDFSGYVSGGTGSLCVRTYVNRTQYQPGNDKWKGEFKNQMKDLSCAQYFNYQMQASDLGTYLTAQYMPYGIIVIYNSGASHATSIRILSDKVIFFDPNEGAVSFPKIENFLAWFEDYKKIVVTRDFGAANYDVFSYQ